MAMALVVARFTLQEAVSRRLILAALVLSVAFVALYAYGFSLLYERMPVGGSSRGGAPAMAIFTTLLTLLGLYAVNFLAGFLALFLSVGAISGEVDGGTLHAVLARPIRRAAFLLGRWLAYASMVAAYVALMGGALLTVSRAISGYEAPDAARAVGLMALSAVVLVTASLLGSTLMSTLANGVVVFTLFGLSWLGGIIEFIGGVMSNDGMRNLGIAVSLVAPNDALWRGASYYAQTPAFLAMSSAAGAGGIPFFSNVPPTPAMLAWGLAYPLVLLGVATLAFSRRDL